MELTNEQRNAPASETNNADRFHEGKEHSHKANDSSTLPAGPTPENSFVNDLHRGRALDRQQA